LTGPSPSTWRLFQALCRAIGGQDHEALRGCIESGELESLIAMARQQDVLPALAVRCTEQFPDKRLPSTTREQQLLEPLRENTLRNMEIRAQAINVARRLNEAGIIPLFLKGTALLLTDANDHIGFRKQVDIDLLVKPEQLESAARSLLADSYIFCDTRAGTAEQPKLFGDFTRADRKSAAHHHLPPMLKQRFKATVELHRHFLPKRFQGKCTVQSIFESAVQHQSHDAVFMVPSANYQAIALILGKLVHDGFLARRALPLREAHDYIGLLERSAGELDEVLIQRCCGKSFSRFHHLLIAITGYSSALSLTSACDVSRDLELMELRCNSSGVGKLLNAYARACHLSLTLLHNPARLPTYLRHLRHA